MFNIQYVPFPHRAFRNASRLNQSSGHFLRNWLEGLRQSPHPGHYQKFRLGSPVWKLGRRVYSYIHALVVSSKIDCLLRPVFWIYKYCSIFSEYGLLSDMLKSLLLCRHGNLNVLHTDGRSKPENLHQNSFDGIIVTNCQLAFSSSICNLFN